MESELLKEPWVFPSAKISPLKDEENTAFSTWQENFQDLSGWCMDTFQGQCDFPIGESTPFKLSGTKYEGNSVLTSEEGVSQNLKSDTDDEKWSLKMNITGASERPHGNSYTSLSALKLCSKLKEEHDNAESNVSTSWSNIPRHIDVTASTTTWNKQNGTADNTPLDPGYRISNLDLDDTCPSSFDSAGSQRETWDVLHTVERTGSDMFDLLSYLCDDEMRSPDGSTSTDSVLMPIPRLPTTSSSMTTNSVKMKVENKSETTRRKVENRLTSTVTSTSTECSIVPTRRSERTRQGITTHKVESNKERREKHGKKRCFESDSDDMSNSSYRESRQKNNEASRKSRMNKKAKEAEMAMRAVELERDNRILKMKVEELEKLVTSMRNALLRSALKKGF